MKPLRLGKQRFWTSDILDEEPESSISENEKIFIYMQLLQNILLNEIIISSLIMNNNNSSTVELRNKERFDKEQIGIKELFMDYKPFYTINLLLDKELLPI